MTPETEGMIAGCMKRVALSGCGGCERRDACASLFESLGAGALFQSVGERPEAPRSVTPKSRFLRFLQLLTTAISLPARPGPFQQEVERRMEPLLEAGAARIDVVARQLGCSRQTLYRRLKREGTTFERVLEGLRRRLALRFIAEGMPVKEAAFRLGFSEPSAFSRAFKRWTGSSPRNS